MPEMSFRTFVFICLANLVASAAFAQPAGNTTPAAPTSTGQKPDDAPRPWWERLTFFGDFRARFEGFYQDETATRQRGRFRARIGLRAPIADGVHFTLRLASGGAEDVASANQSFTDFWNRKPINIDQVALVYTPPSAPALTLGAGKFAYPLTRTQMVWDDDLNWEGAYEQVAWTISPVRLRLVAVQAPLSDVSAGSDAAMFGQYAEASFRAGAHTIQVSVADYAFKNPDQIAVALEERTAIRSQQTNAVRRGAGGRVVGYASGFNLVDTIVQATFDTGRRQYPLVALADFVVNTRAVDDQDAGMWLTGSYGRAAAVDTYSVGYTFARIERDAVVSGFNFSDIGPATNTQAHIVQLSYMPKTRLNLDATLLFTRRLRVAAGASNPLLTRLQLDARVAF